MFWKAKAWKVQYDKVQSCLDYIPPFVFFNAFLISHSLCRLMFTQPTNLPLNNGNTLDWERHLFVNEWLYGAPSIRLDNWHQSYYFNEGNILTVPNFSLWWNALKGIITGHDEEEKGLKMRGKWVWKDDNSMTQHRPQTEYVACLHATIYFWLNQAEWMMFSLLLMHTKIYCQQAATIASYHQKVWSIILKSWTIPWNKGLQLG